MAVEELEAIDERPEPGAVDGEAGRSAGRRLRFVRRIRVGGDERRPVRARGAQHRLDTFRHGDV